MSVLGHRYALRSAIAALAIALLAFGLVRRSSTHAPAPPLPRTALAGSPVTVTQLRGHAVAIAFFSSSCVPCHTEAPALERFARSAAGRGRLLAVDDSDPDDPRAFVARYHWTFPVLSDPKGSAGAAYGVSALPTTVIVDAAGRIVARDSGAQSVASLTRALTAADH
jgi:peroxiredoxin